MTIPMNTLGIVRRNIARADKAAVDKLSKFGVATIHEAMGRVGLMTPAMRPIYAGAHLFDKGAAIVAAVVLSASPTWAPFRVDSGTACPATLKRAIRPSLLKSNNASRPLRANSDSTCHSTSEM